MVFWFHPHALVIYSRVDKGTIDIMSLNQHGKPMSGNSGWSAYEHKAFIKSRSDGYVDTISLPVRFLVDL